MSSGLRVKKITSQLIVELTPTINTTAYTSGDQLGEVLEIPGFRNEGVNLGGTANLSQILILDKSTQAAAIDFVLFNGTVAPTIASVNNGAYDLTDASLLAACIGGVSVGSTYIASSSNKFSLDRNINQRVKITANSTSLWVVGVVRGTPTYAVGDLKWIFFFDLD